MVSTARTSATDTTGGGTPMLFLQTTRCPEAGCHLPAEITDRFVLQSTDGPIEHVKIYCLGKHIFVMPVERLLPIEQPAPRLGTDFVQK